VEGTSIREFSSIALVLRIIERAEEIWDNGLFRQALFVVEMAADEAIRFFEVNANPETVNHLRERLAIIERSCTYLSQNFPWPALVEPARSCVMSIQTILTDGRTFLAENLTSELESLTAPQVEFSNLLIAQLGCEESDPIQLKAIVQECGMTIDDSWRSATSRLVSGYLAEISARLPSTVSSLNKPRNARGIAGAAFWRQRKH
jgi:hypothetical protein